MISLISAGGATTTPRPVLFSPPQTAAVVGYLATALFGLLIMSPAAPRMKMSEYELPLHIQEEILKRLPVKSLVQFRSISKAWKSLIDSSQFIAAHSLTQQQHLLVSYENWVDYQAHYVCYIDDDTFPQQRSTRTLPLSVRNRKISRVVGSSCGLLCLLGINPEMFVLWNPSIRKSIDIVIVSVPSFAGFGVCPVTSDPKIVAVTQSWDKSNSYQCEVMVYTLSSGNWRILSTNLPTKQMQYWRPKVVTDGDRLIYWLSVLPTHQMIMSFDVTNETFEAIDLPRNLADRDRYLDIFKLRESLAIIQSQGNTRTIWMMEDGVQRLFTKLFTIKTPCEFIAGFRKNGIPIMHVTNGYSDFHGHALSKLVAFEPTSGHNNVVQTCASLASIDVNSYVETLLLLGHSDCEVTDIN